MLFNLTFEVAFGWAPDETSDGLKINGANVNCIRYADVTVLIANSEVGLQNRIDTANSA